jgi:hypothetical protein
MAVSPHRQSQFWGIALALPISALFGFAGLLVAVPVAASLGVLGSFAGEQYPASPFCTGRLPPWER